MNKESTLYDYTRSAEELRVFELGETCSRIIHEYEMFNLQNDVYKMFGEWLLNEAKTGYSATFTEKILNKFLEDKNLTRPGEVYIKSKKSDLESCEKLRELTNSRRWDERWNGWGGFETDYAWYTFGKIAKSYNCKNGCVVLDAPSYLLYGGDVAIALNWSKEAQNCISHERWKDFAKKETPFGLCMLVCGIIGAILGILLAIVLAIIHISAWIILEAYFGFVAFCAVIVAACMRPKFIELEMDIQATDFKEHCKKIEETRYSRYGV